MFKSKFQGAYAFLVITGNIVVQVFNENVDFVTWLILLNLALASIFPYVYEKWLGNPLVKNSGFGQNAGYHELVRFAALFLLTLPIVFLLIFG
ncbi:MAG: hypothetical protein M3Q07_12110 [Pseudobdellovibrionaceae bacterium]|nr:hypothetical protein [Pseudobdellovibrionaceae bacterium]